MTLYLPISSRESSKTACIGKFLTPGEDHLAIANNRGIAFKQVSGEKDLAQQDAFLRLDLSLSTVVQLVSVPYLSRDHFESMLDILAVHIHTVDPIPVGEPNSSYDKILMKRFDKETKEFISLGEFTGTPSSTALGRRTKAVLTVLPISVPGYGTLALSDESRGQLYLINPLKPTVVSTYYDGNGLIHPYLISPNILAVVHEKQFIHTIRYVEVRASRSASKDTIRYTFKVLNSDRSPQHPIRCIAPLTETEHLIIDDEGNLKLNGLHSEGHKLLELSRSLVASDANGLSCELLTHSSEKGCVILLNATQAVKVDVDFTAHLMFIEEGPRSISSQLKPGASLHRKIRPDGRGSRKLVELVYDDAAQTLVQTALWPQLPLSQDLRLLSHRFDESIGSTFWSSLGPPERQEYVLAMTHRVVNLHFEELSHTPDKVVGIWKMKESPQTFLISTASKSCVIEITSDTKSIPADIQWVNRTVPTLAASQFLQVTRDSVIYSNGVAYCAELDKVVSSAADDEIAVLASSSSVHVIHKAVKLLEFDFNTLVLDVACCNGFLAVMTIDCLHVYLHSKKVYVEPLTFIGATVVLTPDGEAFVGSVAGDMYLYPSKQSVRVSQSSISYMCYLPQRRSILASTVSNEVFIITTGLDIDRTTHRGCQAAAPLGAKETVVVKDGRLGIIRFYEGFGIAKELVHLPKVPGCAKYVRLTETALYTWHSNILYCTSLTVPYSTLQFMAPQPFDYTVFMINEQHLLSLGKRSTEHSESIHGGSLCDYLCVNLHSLHFSSKGASSIFLKQSIPISLLDSGHHQLGIKFISPTRFIVHSSMESIPFEYDKKRTKITQLGQVGRTYSRLATQKWLHDADADNIWVVHPSGEVDHVFDSTYLTSSDPRYPGSDHKLHIFGYEIRNPSFVNMRDRWVVDALNLGRRKTSGAFTTRLAAAVVSPRRVPKRGVVFVDIEENSFTVSRQTELQLDDHDFRLVAPHQEFLKSLRSKAEDEKLDFLLELAPDAIIGGRDGAISYASLIEDSDLLSALQSLQSALLKEFKMTELPGEVSSSLIDGSLLIEGLSKPELHGIFWKCGVNPDKLARTLQLILY